MVLFRVKTYERVEKIHQTEKPSDTNHSNMIVSSKRSISVKISLFLYW